MLEEIGWALAGGALIGLASGALLVFNGRIAGISGIVGGLLAPRGDALWRAAFIAGLLGAGLALGLLMPQAFPTQLTASSPLLIVAGLLVGVGTRLGSGCTSGHGVCGISRLSARSIVATLIFMGFGMITVALMRHALGMLS